MLVGFYVNNVIGKRSVKPQDNVSQTHDRDKTDLIAHFTPSKQKNGKFYYDGGKGMDVLRLYLTRSEIKKPKFQADMIRIQYYFHNIANPHSKTGKGTDFPFGSFDLIIRNVEILEIEFIKTKKADVKKVKPKILHLKNISFDSIA